ncbi:unnamed protein product, partial [Mesorhabditis belari]|uniref:ethanolamine kinase n=1 Tax=Mesorhabditis belari TaxID=2138241 RepID=A0AAF3F623_9BILA
MDLERIDIELSLLDKEECENGARNILRKIKPKWNGEQVKFEIFTAGITNKIFAAFVDEEDKVIFRVFGKNTEKIIDRAHELKSWAVLAEKGLAAPLIGLFSNGIICGYLPGNNLNVDLVRETKMQRKIAEAMARMHKISIDSNPKKPFEKTKAIRGIFHGNRF